MSEMGPKDTTGEFRHTQGTVDLKDWREGYTLKPKEIHRLIVFENRVLRRFGEEVTRGWRQLHSDELLNLCSQINMIKYDKMKML